MSSKTSGIQISRIHASRAGSDGVFQLRYRVGFGNWQKVHSNILLSTADAATGEKERSGERDPRKRWENSSTGQALPWLCFLKKTGDKWLNTSWLEHTLINLISHMRSSKYTIPLKSCQNHNQILRVYDIIACVAKTFWAGSFLPVCTAQRTWEIQFSTASDLATAVTSQILLKPLGYKTWGENNLETFWKFIRFCMASHL